MQVDARMAEVGRRRHPRESLGKKGDHLIGDFYVLFDKHFKAEVASSWSRSR